MFKRSIFLLSFVTLLSACEQTKGVDRSIDTGWDRKKLSSLKAGIWVDPNGCQHWMVDDGIEGYLSPRLHPDGTPVCDLTLPRATVLQDQKSGSPVGDIF